MYVGRLFFRKDTGNLIYWYEAEGDIVVPTVEQDLTAIVPLQEYVHSSVEVVELSKEDVEVRTNCRNATSVRLDLTTKQLIFDFTPIYIEKTSLEQRINDIELALANLMGV